MILTAFPNAYSDTSEVPSEGQERLIVELDSDYNPLTGELPRVKVCFQKWATGIGWFNQKSLSLTVEQAAQLKMKIEQTTVNLKMRSSQARPDSAKRLPQTRKSLTSAETGPAIIQFPAGRSKKPLAGEPEPSAREETNLSTNRILPFRSR